MKPIPSKSSRSSFGESNDPNSASLKLHTKTQRFVSQVRLPSSRARRRLTRLIRLRLWCRNSRHRGSRCRRAQQFPLRREFSAAAPCYPWHSFDRNPRIQELRTVRDSRMSFSVAWLVLRTTQNKKKSRRRLAFDCAMVLSKSDSCPYQT